MIRQAIDHVLILFTLFSLGCAAKKETDRNEPPQSQPEDPQPPDSDPGNESEDPDNRDDHSVKVNGLSPMDYYGQLMYQFDAEKKMYRVVIPSIGITLKETASGALLRANLTLYLLDDHTYTIHYSECEDVRMESGETSCQQTDAATLKGKWSIKGVDIQIEHLGTGNGINVNSAPGFGIRSEKSIISDEFKGKYLLMVRGYSTAKAP